MDLLNQLTVAIKTCGGTPYLVGGSVRDALMNRDDTDKDVEVYGLSNEALESVLKAVALACDVKLDLVGKHFAVYKLGDIDVSLPRREKKTGTGHKGFAVVPDGFMSPQQAVLRRDFTVNALMQNLLTGEVHDFTGDGRRDLNNKVLRMVSFDTFADDSLRVLRAARFASTLGFDVEDFTVTKCNEVDLTDLPSERVWGELKKILMSPKPSVGLFWLNKLGVTQQLFPELYALVGVKQEKAWHPEGDVDVHTSLVVNVARNIVSDLPYERALTVVLAAMCHDFGKATTTVVGDKITAHGHAEAGVALADAFLTRLKVNTVNGCDVKGQVLSLVKYHLSPAEFHKNREKMNVKSAVKRLATKVDLDLLYRVSKADSLGRNYDGIPVPFDAQASEWFLDQARSAQVENKPEVALFQGRDLIALGFKPAKWFGDVLSRMYDAQLDGRFNTVESATEHFQAFYAETLPR